MPSPGTWLRALQSHEHTNALPPLLQKDPLDTFRRPHGDFLLAQQCLETYVASQESKGDPKEVARLEYIQAKPGSLALLWFLEAQGPNRFDFGLQPGLLRCIIYCLIAEQAEEQIWHWLTVHHAPTYAASWTGSEQMQWKGLALRYLLEDKAYWAATQEGALPLEEAHKSLCRAMDDNIQRRGSSGEGYVPKYIAGNWLFHHLLTSHGQHLKASIYDRFIHMTRVWNSDPFRHQLQQARLHLVHPTRPTPWPALEFLKLCDSADHNSVYIYDITNPLDGAMASMLFWFTVQCAQLLSRQGHTGEARLSLDIGKSLMPKYFTIGYNNPYKAKQHHAPRHLAGPALVQSGTVVDKHGTTEYSKRRRDARTAQHDFDARSDRYW